LQWKFYSTKDGREVSYNLPGPTNTVEPLETKYRENPEMPQGKMKQVDYAVEGADVNVTRTSPVTVKLLYQDKFFTRYEPWGDVLNMVREPKSRHQPRRPEMRMVKLGLVYRNWRKK
jgi:hypothetical protein